MWVRVVGVPMTTIPPPNTTTLNPPVNAGQILYAMYHTWNIAGHDIIAKSLKEAFAYFKNYCMNVNG
jgi:hypothetical protein